MSESTLQSDISEALGYVKTDALSNLASKRGCIWANRLIVASVEAVEHFETVKDFYLKEKKAELQDMFSAFLQKKGSCLDLWQDACGACIKEKTPPNAKETEALDFVGGVLWQNFLSVFGQSFGAFSAYDCTGVAVRMREVDEADTETNRKALKESIQFHTLNIAETCYRLTLREWEIWYRHEDWPVGWGEFEVNGPFDGRGAVEALYPALKAFDEKHPYAFYDLYLALHGLNNESVVLPRAFVFKDSKSSPARSFDEAVVALLTMETQIIFRYPPDLVAAMGYEEQSYVPSPFLTKARNLFLVKLYNNIRANAKKAPSDGSRRMWFEAAAELLQNTSMRQPVYTQEAAERILSLANRAQRESWIERMMERAKRKKEMEPAEFTPAPSEPAKAEPAIDEQAIVEKTQAFAKAYIDGLRDAGGSGKGGNRKGNKKNGKKDGKGKRRGRQTPVMIEQFAALQDYLNRNHVPRNCSYETLKKWINSFWNENKKEYDKSAKAKGDKKGYGSVAMMFRAAKNKGYGQ